MGHQQKERLTHGQSEWLALPHHKYRNVKEGEQDAQADPDGEAGEEVSHPPKELGIK
jgi:hypothetical protein